MDKLMAMGLSCGPMVIEMPANSWVHVWMMKNVSNTFNTGLAWASQWWMGAKVQKIRGTKRSVKVFHMQQQVALKLYQLLNTQITLNESYIKYSSARSQVDDLETDHHLRSIKAAFTSAGINKT